MKAEYHIQEVEWRKTLRTLVNFGASKEKVLGDVIISSCRMNYSFSLMEWIWLCPQKAMVEGK